MFLNFCFYLGRMRVRSHDNQILRVLREKEMQLFQLLNPTVNGELDTIRLRLKQVYGRADRSVWLSSSMCITGHVSDTFKMKLPA